LLRLSSDAGVQPSLGSISFTFLSGTVSPDNWEVDANGTIVLNTSIYRFGTKSGYLQAITSAATKVQPKRNTGEYDVAVLEDTEYIFSAYVRPDLNTAETDRTIKLRVYEASGNSASLGAEIGSGSANYTEFESQDGWYRLTYQFSSPGGFVKPVIEFGTGTGAAAGDGVFLDGAQVEEGKVVRSWTPGFVTQAITIEGGGITVDKQNGGSFRLRGSDAGSIRNVVSLGAKGLEFGGATNPAEIYSTNESQLDFAAGGGVSASVNSAGLYLPAGKIINFEGTTADASETTLTAGEPTAVRTITLPDATGTVALTNSRFAQNHIAAPGANTTIATSVTALNGLSVTFTPTYTEQVAIHLHVIIIQTASPASAVNMNIRAQLDGVSFSEFGYTALSASHGSPSAFTLSVTCGFQAVAGTTYTVRGVAQKSGNFGTYVANSTGSGLFLNRVRE
jgi:hypothetical protein